MKHEIEKKLLHKSDKNYKNLYLYYVLRKCGKVQNTSEWHQQIRTSRTKKKEN